MIKTILYAALIIYYYLIFSIMSWDSSLISVMFVSQLQFSLEPEPVAVNCTAFNHNGNLLVTGAADGVIRLFGQYFLLGDI